MIAGRVSAQHLVRTDGRERKLDAFLISRGSALNRSDASAANVDDETDFETRLLPTVCTIAISWQNFCKKIYA